MQPKRVRVVLADVAGTRPPGEHTTATARTTNVMRVICKILST